MYVPFLFFVLVPVSPPPPSLPRCPFLSFCGVTVARPDELLCQRECSSEGGEALFLSERCIFFLVNRHGCILDSPSQSPSFPLYFSVFFFLASLLSPSLPLSLLASYLELYRGQIEGIIFLRLNFSAMQ